MATVNADLRTSAVSERRLALRALAVGSGLTLALGILRSGTLAGFLVYSMVVAAALLPALIWIRSGAQGIPVLPAFALLHVFYFALPIVNRDDVVMESSSFEIARAAGTVCLFLAAATLASSLFSGKRRRVQAPQRDVLSEKQMVTFLLVGLGLGVIYHISLMGGALGGLGTWFGLVRSIVTTALVVACFFLGVARARGFLRRARWGIACAGLGTVVGLSWSSLFLVGGATYILAAALGFIITSKRIPWLAVIAVFAVVSLLHAGKAEMRAEYWEHGQNVGRVSSVTQLPGVAVEWVGAGLKGLTSGAKRGTALDRTALLPLLLRAQLLTPQHIDYLRGETYALLPGMLVPRFLSPNKTKSQAGMDLLNIRYGILTVEGVGSTAVGWGLIAEAWANFGFLGEILIGLLVGVFAGALMRWSAGASAVSRPTLVAIIGMTALLNLEADLAGLIATLFQTIVGVLLFLGIFRVFAPRRRARSSPQVSRIVPIRPRG